MRRGRRKGDGGLTGKRHLCVFFSSLADERDPRVKEQGHAVRHRVLRTRDAGKEAGLCARTCGLRASASASWAALLAGPGKRERGRVGRQGSGGQAGPVQLAGQAGHGWCEWADGLFHLPILFLSLFYFLSLYLMYSMAPIHVCTCCQHIQTFMGVH